MPHSRRQPSRPAWKTALLGCGIGCGSALLLGVIAALIVLHKLTAVPPGVAPPSQPSGSAAAPAQAQPQPPPYEAQKQQIEAAARTGQPTPVALRLSESQINDLIAQNAGGDPTVRNVRVTLGSGDMTLSGTGYWRGRQVYVTAMGRPQAVGGRPHFQLYSVRVGTLGLPGSAVARFQAEIDRGMADWAARNPYDVTDVSVANGELVMSGTTRPQ